MLAPIYEWKVFNQIVSMRSVLVPAYPRPVGFDMLSAIWMGTRDTNRPLVQNVEI